jgi:hypothetical protein
MDSNIASQALQYAGISIEVALVVYLARRSLWKRHGALAFYLSSLLLTELTRAYVLHANGLGSRRFFYVYWSTDFLLVISAFLLVCLFFRRACLREEKMWAFVRLLLPFTFILVIAISSAAFLHHYRHLFFTYFIIEFNQNLYFSCLVLNTLLYLLLQYIESTDDQLGLLVCGMGIQFAGPAATLALVHLTEGESFARSLNSFIMRVCTLGMLLVWAYAIVHVRDKAIQVAGRDVPVLAEVTASSNV